jgi:two-component sensor histidine kinase
VDEEKANDSPAVAPAGRPARGRWTSLAVLLLVAAALLASVFLIFNTIEAERQQRAHVVRTNDVLRELDAIGRAALNAETGERGYMITLDRRYLAPYSVAQESYRAANAQLRELVEPGATTRQRQLLDRIEILSQAKFAELDTVVALIDRGDILSARKTILTDEGQEAMERLRRSLRELEQIEQRDLVAAAQDTAAAEARVMPLIVLLVALILVALVFGYLLVTRATRAEAEAANAGALAEARDRADLLARELNHRVKNLFAVVLAIVRMSAKDSPEAKPTTERIAERIRALLTAHEVTQGELDKPVASLETLIETTLRPYRSDTARAELAGPEVLLPARQVTPLGLVLHELTTNAVKYGCWASGGTLSVSWRREGEDIVLLWAEDCPHDGAEPDRKGFGSLLMTSAARQLRGTIDRQFTPKGVRVTIRMPVEA